MTTGSEADLLDGRPAGFVTRLLAFAADIAIVAGIIALGGWIAVLVDNLLETLGLDPRLSLAALYVFLIPFIAGLYFVVFWSLTGRTIGKSILGLKVVAPSGMPPSIGRSILRVLGYVLSAMALWAGYLWVLVDADRKAWHDHMANTYVVYDYSREPARAFLVRGTAEDTTPPPS
jgi:uncharacterized RDD family membrane protein YckC